MPSLETTFCGVAPRPRRSSTGRARSTRSSRARSDSRRSSPRRSRSTRARETRRRGSPRRRPGWSTRSASRTPASTGSWSTTCPGSPSSASRSSRAWADGRPASTRRRWPGSARTRRCVAIELNVSCPNVESGCISIGTDAGETRALVERCRDETDVPVLAKLSPSVTEIEAIATAAAEGGAHGLVLINTVRGIAIDRDDVAAAPGRRRGRAVRPGDQAGRRSMRSTTRALRPAFRSSGWGASPGPQDVSEFLAAGATLVGIGTALFRDPGVVGRASAELLADLERRGASGPGEPGGRRPSTHLNLKSSLSVVGRNSAYSGRSFPVAHRRGHGYNRPLR